MHFARRILGKLPSLDRLPALQPAPPSEGKKRKRTTTETKKKEKTTADEETIFFHDGNAGVVQLTLSFLDPETLQEFCCSSNFFLRKTALLTIASIYTGDIDATSPPYYDDGDFQSVEDYFMNTFDFVSTCLLGHGHPIGLKVVEFCGADGSGPGAETDAMYLFCKESENEPDGKIDLGRGGSNIPWGIQLSDVITLDDDEETTIRAQFANLRKNTGFKKVGGTDYKLITEASGG